MKFTLTTALLLTGMTLFAQPVFEHSFSESANIAFLDKLGEVYYTMDVVNKKCLIYNMDQSLLKSIDLPVPEGYYLSDIQYVSESLFNQDDLVELVYIYSKYVPTTLSYYYTFETRLINENGADLLSLPSGSGYTAVIETPGHGKKFLVYEYNYSVIPYLTNTHVYSLPEAGTKAVSQTLIQGNAYPNPANTQIHIPVALPAGIDSGFLEIMDMNGRRVLSYPISSGTGNVVLPTRQFASGTYLYQVRSAEGESEARKIVFR